MKPIEHINAVKNIAGGKWQAIFEQMGISTNRSEGPCPACGGKTRYRFDDKDGRGTYFCSHCGAGTGLDLVMKVNQCGAREAAEMVAVVLGIDERETVTTASQGKTSTAADHQQERREKAAKFISGWQKDSERATPGPSPYLTRKGFPDAVYPVLPDGKTLVALVNESGTIVAGQRIPERGEKRLIAGSAKKGAFCLVHSGESPETVILAEGLATAHTVAQLRPDALTVYAVDAGNLLPVADVMRCQHPDAQLIIAADNDWHAPGERDEKGKLKTNTGRIAAENAARAVNGWIAVPPTDHKADWNDYHQQYGLESAAAAFNDLMYQPEGKNVKLQLKAIEGGKSGQPESDPLKPRIESRKNGVFWVTPKVDKDSGEIITLESWLCSPLEIAGYGYEGTERYLVVGWKSPRGEKITRAIPFADIGEREGWRSLKAGGVNVTTKSTLRAILADWLQQNGNGQEWRISLSAGWHFGAYIMPDGEVLGEPETPILFNGRSAAAAGYSVAGTVESWRDSVARLSAGNPSMMLGVAASLAAPLIGLVGAEGFGVHLFEQSSAGKTTTANIASSLWGDPDALRLTWYGTALGIANEAEAHNDSLLPLDEVGQGSSAKEVATSAYTLFNGAGKLQGAREGGNRDLKRWRTVAISTGEMDIETFLSAGGLKVKAGQLVRLLNLPMEKSVTYHEYQNGKQHADALKDAYQHHHGAAAREWVKWLADHKEHAKRAVKDAQARWRGLIPADYGEQVHRVSERFAILEAALLLSGNITGWSEQASRDAIQHNFNAWVKEFGTGNKEHQQILEQCEAFLNAYGVSRFAPLPYDPASLPIRDLAGYRKRKSNHDDAPMIFYTFPATFEKEIAAGFNVKQFARVLLSVGVLSGSADGQRFQKKSPRVDGRQINVYILQHQAESDGE